MKLVSGIAASLTALLTLLGILRNRWKIWTDPDNARKGNPEQLASYIELYTKLPAYVPAKNELLATIQEMTLDIAQDPFRIARRRDYRHQLYSMITGVAMLLVGLYVFVFGHLHGVVSVQIIGGLLILCGLLFAWVLPISMILGGNKDEARVKAKRAAYMREHKWLDEVEVEPKRPPRS